MTHHHVGHLLSIGFSSNQVSDIVALSKDSHPVGNLLNLIELMGNDDDGLTVLLHIGQNLEELLCLLGSQNRCGLVKNKNVGTSV